MDNKLKDVISSLIAPSSIADLEQTTTHGPIKVFADAHGGSIVVVDDLVATFDEDENFLEAYVHQGIGQFITGATNLKAGRVRLKNQDEFLILDIGSTIRGWAVSGSGSFECYFHPHILKGMV